MATYRYELPKKTTGSPWEKLSDAAKASLMHIAVGTVGQSEADQLLTPNSNCIEGLAADVEAWAKTDFEAINWSQYPDHFGLNTPASLQDLAATSPNFASTITRLYEAKQALASSGETTPSGINIGETMHLALMPWQAMRDHLSGFSEWVKTLRDHQNIADRSDFIHTDLLVAIRSNLPLYRNSVWPAQLLTPTQYLDKQIDKDGPWGVMLVQTSDEEGIMRLIDQSPNAMTDNGTMHLELAGQSIDAMGVFEWIALTMQMDPSQLSPANFSWLLANRVWGLGEQFVPRGDWTMGVSNVRTDLFPAYLGSVTSLVRPAVM